MQDFPKKQYKAAYKTMSVSAEILPCAFIFFIS